jgi:site-specific DNA-methyltransferase (adenine-specific)
LEGTLKRVEIGDCVLYCGDCLEVMPTLEAGSVDAVVTDPPYGIDWQWHGGSTRKWNAIANDSTEYDLRFVLNMECMVVSFGANNYAHQLPHKGLWICWDKRVNENADRMLGYPFELAWCNKRTGFGKMYRVMHGGVVNADGHNVKRVHPTQKPIRLMECVLNDFTATNFTVLDPFMGSGTTGVACVNTNRKFIGIELDETYFNIACERIREAYRKKSEELPLSA